MSRQIYISAILIGVVSTALGYFAYLTAGKGSIWGITTGESKLGGIFWKSLGLPVDQLHYFQQFKLINTLEDPTQLIVFSIIFGGLFTALLTKSFVIKHIPDKWMLLQAIVGGALLGYGARLALGCNIGNFLSAWAAGGVHAAIFTAALLPGTYLGLKFTEHFFLPRATPRKASYSPPLTTQPWIGIVFAVAALAVTPLLKPLATVWWVAGLAFGALGWISGICFASCYRDLVAPKYASGVMVKAIGLAVLTYSTGVYILQLINTPFSLTPPQIGVAQILIGGVVFGAGIGVAGSCIFSSEWRAGGGSIYSLIVLLSTILIGMPALALHYDWWLAVLPQDPKPFTLYNFGPHIGYIAPLSFSLILILFGSYIDTATRNAVSTWLGAKLLGKQSEPRLR